MIRGEIITNTIGKKPGAGRKPVGTTSATTSLTIRITPMEKELIASRAAAEGMSISKYIRVKCLRGN